MKWYQHAMALDPGAWRYDPQPHRLTEHHNIVHLPGGRFISQPQSPKNIKDLYQGIHMTDSPALAGIYANNKATEDDPPVIIEISTGGIEKRTDADASQAQMDILDYFSERANEWKLILESNEDPDDKMYKIMEDLYADSESFERDNEDMDLGTIAADHAKDIPPHVIHDYLEKMDAEQGVQAVAEMLNGDIPDEVLISSVNQFRTMKPIEEESIIGIYQIPRLAEEVETGLWDMEEEYLEEKGYKKGEDGEVYDSQGRLVLDIENFDVDTPFGMTPLYENPQKSSGPSSWHGTTLNRARNALPGIFRHSLVT